MDINLTGQVAASLTQSPWISIGSGAIGGLVTGFITLYGVKMTQKHGEKKEEQNRKSTMLQKKKQVYSELMGLKKPLIQTHQSFHRSNIQMCYLNFAQNCRSICNQDVSTLFQLYQEEARKCNDIILKGAENERDLWRTIGLIQVMFSNSSILNDSIANISKIEKELEELNKKVSNEKSNYLKDINNERKSLSSQTHFQWIQTKDEIINSWRDSRSNDAKEQTNALESGIDDLLKCLKDQIQEEGSALIG